MDTCSSVKLRRASAVFLVSSEWVSKTESAHSPLLPTATTCPAERSTAAAFLARPSSFFKGLEIPGWSDPGFLLAPNVPTKSKNFPQFYSPLLHYIFFSFDGDTRNGMQSDSDRRITGTRISYIRICFVKAADPPKTTSSLTTRRANPNQVICAENPRLESVPLPLKITSSGHSLS
jgi:hypothetical protein